MRLRELVAPVVSVIAPRRRRDSEPQDPKRTGSGRDSEASEASRPEPETSGDQSPDREPDSGGIDRYA